MFLSIYYVKVSAGVFCFEEKIEKKKPFSSGLNLIIDDK